MEKKNWFVPKPYGWGLAPTCWQGWLATLFYVVFLVVYLGFGYDLFMNVRSVVPGDIIKMIFDIFVSGVVFVYLMEGKTEGKVVWYWGNTKKD